MNLFRPITGRLHIIEIVDQWCMARPGGGGVEQGEGEAW